MAELNDILWKHSEERNKFLDFFSVFMWAGTKSLEHTSIKWEAPLCMWSIEEMTLLCAWIWLLHLKFCWNLMLSLTLSLRVTVKLRYYPKDYIQEFMAESVSFLLRNAPVDQVIKGITILLWLKIVFLMTTILLCNMKLRCSSIYV